MRFPKGLIVVGLLGFVVIAGPGCATHEPYHGPISSYYAKVSAQRPATPIPAQLIVHSSATEDPQTKSDLVKVFAINMKQTGAFADVVLPGSPTNAQLKRLDLDVNLKVLVSNRTSPWYMASWGCIFPMFMPWNEITAEGQMTATVSDEGRALKTYESTKTSKLGRNSVGLAYVRIETRTLERWCRPALTALFDDVINQIVADSATYETYRTK